MRISVTRRPLVPTTLPVSLHTALEHMRVSDQGALFEVQRFVLAAAREIEDAAQIALLHQEITVTVEDWSEGEWPMVPIGPARTDLPAALIQLGTSYALDVAGWAGTRFLPRASFQLAPAPFALTYTAGFGTSDADVPEDLSLAVLDQALAYFDFRATGGGNPAGLSPHAARIIGRYRGVRL